MTFNHILSISILIINNAWTPNTYLFRVPCFVFFIEVLNRVGSLGLRSTLADTLSPMAVSSENHMLSISILTRKAQRTTYDP